MLKIQKSFSNSEGCLYVRLYDGVKLITEKDFNSHSEADTFIKQLKISHKIA